MDSILVRLPENVNFIPGSFDGIYNAPVDPVPGQYTLNNYNYLVWLIPPGIAEGDSTIFTFEYNGDPSQTACDIKTFQVNTISYRDVMCVLTGNLCDINVVTGQETLPVFTYKADLSFV